MVVKIYMYIYELKINKLNLDDDIFCNIAFLSTQLGSPNHRLEYMPRKIFPSITQLYKLPKIIITCC